MYDVGFQASWILFRPLTRFLSNTLLPISISDDTADLSCQFFSFSSFQFDSIVGTLHSFVHPIVMKLNPFIRTNASITWGIITGYYMGYTLIWVLSTSDTCHMTNEWAQRTSEWYDMCHELIKSISKCNPCHNLFITYHIKGLWGCINAWEMLFYHTSWPYNLQIGMFFMTQTMACSALCTSGPAYCLRYVCDVF